MTPPAVSCRDLTASYGQDVGVFDLSFDVARGEVFGFLGRNGAGKSTTIRLLLDLLRPDRGSVAIFGAEVRAGNPAARARLGYLPGDLSLYGSLGGAATLDLFANLRGVAPTRRDDVLDRLSFPRAALSRPTRTYSTGMRQAIGLTLAFQHDPDLLVLDEPTTGLDPRAREGFLDLVRDARARGKTVFLSSHVLDEVERVADRVGLIARGRLRLTATLDELRARLPRRVVVARRDGTTETFDHKGPVGPLFARLAKEDPADATVTAAPLDVVFREFMGGDDA
jgi:ABC-2 type transport system ATP-binding protein